MKKINIINLSHLFLQKIIYKIENIYHVITRHLQQPECKEFVTFPPLIYFQNCFNSYVIIRWHGHLWCFLNLSFGANYSYRPKISFMHLIYNSKHNFWYQNQGFVTFKKDNTVANFGLKLIRKQGRSFQYLNITVQLLNFFYI